MRFVPGLGLRRTTLGALAVASWLAFPSDSRGAPQTASSRLTAKTAEAMLAQARERGTVKGAHDAEILSAALVAAQVTSASPRGAGQAALSAIASVPTDPGLDADARGDVSLLARVLSGDEGTDAGVAADRKLGVATDVAVLGPFRDTGGGLHTPLGPEASGKFADAKVDYSWGSYLVRWRAVPARFSGAAGIPLDVFVHPRRESCSLVATRVTVDRDRPLVVRLAASGQAALYFDGALVGASEAVNELARFDRLAGRVDASAGDHLVVAKVCSAALDDDGRVRIRFTDAAGAPLPLPTSATLVDRPAKAPRVTPLETPLAHVSAQKAGAGSALTLAAATVRTLGGADDLKSPQAPGLLDAYVQDKSLDADHIAFAAWITPSAANRTGWYGRADARAGAGDPETVAFVRRRQVAERLRAQLADWAYAGARSVGLDRDKDDEAAYLTARIDESLAIDALRARALRNLVARYPNLDAAPSDPLRVMARLAKGLDAPLATRALAALDARGVVDTSLVRLVGQRDAARARELAAATVLGRIDDIDEGVEVASELARSGQAEATRELATALVAFAPNRSDVVSLLAEAILSAPRDPADRDRALALLARARELAPGEARTRAELLLRKSAKTGSSETQPDEKYLVPSETILARRGGAPRAGEAPDVRERELHWLRAVRMHPDKRVSQLIQYAREIVIAPRSQDELYENLPLEGDLIEILRARVHRRDGSIALPLEEHNEGTRPRVRWPELAPGDTVEVAIRTWTSGPVGGRGDPPFYFLDYAGSLATSPILYNEVVVESARENPIFVDVVGGGADTKDERDEGPLHVTRLVWKKPKSIPEEPLAPQLTELVPLVVGSTFRTWADFRAWYTEAVKGFTEPDAEVRRLAAELTKGKTTREAKLRAIFDFVSDQIRYVNYTSGEFWLPNRPHQLLARREGDCDDKAILLITLLKAVGIEAQEVLVQTRETGQPSVLRAKNAAAPLFDHGIAFLPGPNGGTYLDATSPQSRLGPLPSMDARASALRIGMAPEIVELPSGSPDDHGSEVDWTIALTPEGSAEIRGTEMHSGDSAFYLRTYLAQEGARASYVEGNLLGPWVPTVEVDGAIDFAGDLGGGRARVKYKARSEGLARHEGAELVAPLAPNRTLASQLAPLVRRTLPVSLPPQLAPSRQRRALRIVAPTGYAWGDLPAGGKVDGGDFGRAELDIGVDPRDPRAVVARRTVVLDRHVIPPERYEAWRSFLQRIDALMARGVRLVPVRGAR